MRLTPAPLALLLLLLLALPVAAAPKGEAAPADDAKAFLEAIYAKYVGPGSTGADFGDREKFAAFFDAELTALYAKDLEESKGEVGRLDADPFVGAQDWEIAKVDLSVEPAGKDKARAVATLHDAGGVRKVELDLARTKAGWRIADVRWPPDGGSLKGVLSSETN